MSLIYRTDEDKLNYELKFINKQETGAVQQL